VTELQQNRYDQLLRRVGDLKGPGSKVNDVLQELFPTIDVENVPIELLFLMGTRVGWGASAKVPTAGKKAGIQLFNPTGSGQLITITSVWISSTESSSYTFGLTNTAFGTNTGIPRLRDSRAGSGPSGVAELRTTADAVSLVSGIVRLAGNRTLFLNDLNGIAVLSPGAGMSVVGTVDDQMNVTFLYRERIAEPSELTF